MKTCCGVEPRFVDNGPRLQYWFCDECRKEVVPELEPQHTTPLEEGEHWLFFDKAWGSTAPLATSLPSAPELQLELPLPPLKGYSPDLRVSVRVGAGLIEVPAAPEEPEILLHAALAKRYAGLLVTEEP